MSYGAGHVMDMINRMKQNRSQRASNKSKFKENNREGIYSTEKKSKKLVFKTAPKEEIKELRKQIRAQATARRKREVLYYSISIVCLILIIIGILVLMN